MLFLKKVFKPILISFIIILVATFIITLLNYFNIINNTIVNVISYIMPFIAFFIGGFLLGKKSINKGWLEGIKLGIINVLILLIINLFLFKNLDISALISYTLVMSANIIGSILGINKKTS